MRLRHLKEDQDYNFSNLLTNEVQYLGDVFKKHGFEIRVVGGAVRDAVLGKEPKDIDLATNATPDEMLKIARIENIRYIPTGLQHGTVTFVVNNEPYEITTLRVDKDTDGRHATVAWTRSFKEDARRRDLTFNALSVDMNGNLYDYFGGVEDLKNGRVEFVGNAKQRIEEDYLRILRYFRFYGRQENPKISRETYNAIRETAPGLKRISGERIWMEMQKILIGNHVADILELMFETGVAQHIGLIYKQGVYKAEEVSNVTDNPITVLISLIKDNKHWNKVVSHWKLSNPEKELGNFLLEHRNNPLSVADAKELINSKNSDHVFELALYQNNKAVYNAIKNWKVPTFPVNGKDLMAIGIKPGPEMGQILNRLKAHWISNDFKPSKDELLALV